MRTSPELIVSACQAPRAPRHRLSGPRVPRTPRTLPAACHGSLGSPATAACHSCLPRLPATASSAPLGLPSGSPRALLGLACHGGSATVAPSRRPCHGCLPRRLRHGCLPRLARLPSGSPRAFLGLSSGSPRARLRTGEPSLAPWDVGLWTCFLILLDFSSLSETVSSWF